ncbi:MULTISPECIES: hypothetical protein [Arthrobacter]|uniref:Uncharacterized protein n=1 Tax=Arthrobacter terricola TaxID=2547396 RepID=A0A4R5K7V0_9MICC|nr:MULTISPECIES: hypothetical protein [Arthrobacter]MBT8163338.1 hypothetical protein [Arthrobacter sp. GN70]TDF90567.1 hypothetical protein E1809_22175 [Arthrobacter terricola]
MTRPAYVFQSFGLDGVAYLVTCGNHNKARLFDGLESALSYARKHNNKHHQGAVPQLHTWNTKQVELREQSPKARKRNPGPVRVG